MDMMFTATCNTCLETESFDEYSDANEWWREHADDGHVVELTSDAAVPNAKG